MKTLIRIVLLIAFLSMTVFAQDAQQLQSNSQLMKVQASRIELAIMLSQLNNLLDVSNPKTRKIIETVNRKLEIEGFLGLMRNLPPDIKEYEVPLKEKENEDETKEK